MCVPLSFWRSVFAKVWGSSKTATPNPNPSSNLWRKAGPQVAEEISPLRHGMSSTRTGVTSTTTKGTPKPKVLQSLKHIGGLPRNNDSLNESQRILVSLVGTNHKIIRTKTIQKFQPPRAKYLLCVFVKGRMVVLCCFLFPLSRRMPARKKLEANTNTSGNGHDGLGGCCAPVQVKWVRQSNALPRTSCNLSWHPTTPESCVLQRAGWGVPGRPILWKASCGEIKTLRPMGSPLKPTQLWQPQRPAIMERMTLISLQHKR